MESIWQKQTSDIQAKRNTSGNNHRDVIIVGAGLAGILTAYYLQKQGRNVLVLEADTIASGQTNGTTAKITSQHDIKYSKLIRTVGMKKAGMYARANEAAIEEYARLIAQQGIECDFKRVPAYLYTLENEQKIIDEASAAVKLGIDAHYTKKTELPFSVKGAVCFSNQAQFSPLKFVKHIVVGLEISEHTKVLDIRGNKVRTEDKVYTADKIIVATHYPILNVPGFYFLRQHQERSYVLALSGCPEIEGMYYGIDKNGLSFRQEGDALLLGGGSHRTGKSRAKGSYCFLHQEADKYYPAAKVITRWSAQDCMPHDGIPFIGKYSVFTPNLYVITGFQKWGMTSSMIAAMILRDEICGADNPYAEVFSPQRINITAGIKNLLVDIGESVMGLTKGWLGSSKRRCSHMGCELKWNKEERTWDCPCHGSRFDEEGNLLDNPSKVDKK